MTSPVIENERGDAERAASTQGVLQHTVCDFKSPNLNLPRLGFLTLVERDAKHAVVQFRIDLLILDRRRKREAAEEALIAPLVQKVIALLLLRLLALGRDGQRLVLQGDIDIILLEPGQLSLYIDVVGILADFDAKRRPPEIATLAAAKDAAQGRVKFAMERFDRI